MKEYTCKICGKKFKARFKHNETCSIKCKDRALKLKKLPESGIRICEYCGKEYYYIHGQANWTKGGKNRTRGSYEASKYCCYECGKKDISLKIKITKLKKYGNENYNNQEKLKTTCLEKYGTDNVFKNNEIKEKALKTNIKKYGVEFPLQNKEIHNKTVKSSTKKHKIENEIYKLLLEKFKVVYREYSSDLYPWNCDFYIPDLDLYIEFQGHWSHGYYPYDENDINSQKQLKTWKNREFTRAIEVWTKTDPKKRETAKNNNLNWIEFFSINELKEWLKNKG